MSVLVQNKPDVRTDAEILDILEKRDSGLSCRQIGEGLGTTKGAIIGLTGRVDRATEASKHDGTMPRYWWRDGLNRRGSE